MCCCSMPFVVNGGAFPFCCDNDDNALLSSLVLLSGSVFSGMVFFSCRVGELDRGNAGSPAVAGYGIIEEMRMKEERKAI
jgi:hypothetical protein